MDGGAIMVSCRSGHAALALATLLAACDQGRSLPGGERPLQPPAPPPPPPSPVDPAPPAPPPADPAPGGSYLPLKVGAWWVYQVHDPHAPGPHFPKTTTIEAYEPVGADRPNVMAYQVRTTGLFDNAVSWQEVREGAVVRHREERVEGSAAQAVHIAWEPYKIRLDFAPERLRVGSTLTESIGETWRWSTAPAMQRKRLQKWTVEALDEEVKVPAGTFRCLRIHVNGSPIYRRFGNDNKVYWFARGVGKVKEVKLSEERPHGRIVETGLVQELHSYHIP
jgi:hypothetical protein